MTACTNKGSRGSILLETLLVLPLYLVVLGGMFWIGDIKLARQKLVAADRYAAWNAGNRHRLDKGGIENEMQTAFFLEAEVGDQDLVATVYEGGLSTGWSAPVGSTAVLRMRMPEWTRGWLAGSPGWEGVAGLEPSETVVGRSVPQQSRHAVLMRTRFGSRAFRSPDWTARMLADFGRPWDPHVWNEPWPALEELAAMPASGLLFPATGPPGPPGYEHERHPAYIEWSD